MLRALLVTFAVAGLLAAVPVAASAQDAGSGQYEDPLAGEPGSGGGGGGGNSGGGGGGGGGGNANTAPTNGTQGVQNATSGDTSASATGNQLPATGVDAWLIALAGAMLLGGGIGLRRAADRTSF